MPAMPVRIAILCAAATLATTTAPADAQQPPDTSPANQSDTAAPDTRSPAAETPPTLGAGFVLEGVRLSPGLASLDWDDVDAADGYELMYRSADGWELLSEREASSGVIVTFEGSSALVSGLPANAAEW